MGEIIPGEEGELGGAGLFGDAILEGGPGLLRTRVAEGLEETVEEGLRRALFLAFQSFDEVEEGGDQRLGFGGRHGHAAFRGSGAGGGQERRRSREVVQPFAFPAVILCRRAGARGVPLRRSARALTAPRSALSPLPFFPALPP